MWLRAANLYGVVGTRARTLAELFRRERPALVYLANGLRANLDGLIAARRCRIPVVCHEKGFERVGPLERLTSRWLEACICMTEEIEAHCRARHLRARRLLTIYDGIDTAAFAPGGGAAVRRELGIPPDAPLAGIVGHIQDWKGQHLVVEAVARARARFPELRCLLVGGVHRRGAEYAERIHERIARPDLAGTWSDRRPPRRPRLPRRDGLMIHASVVAEPFGRVLIEAMAIGRPVIAPPRAAPPHRRRRRDRAPRAAARCGRVRRRAARAPRGSRAARRHGAGRARARRRGVRHPPPRARHGGAVRRSPGPPSGHRVVAPQGEVPATAGTVLRASARVARSPLILDAS